MPDESLQIRSFRVVFDLERRIHRIDRFKVPLPYGLPLRSIGYAAVALIAVVVGSNVPLFGSVLSALPAPVRLVILPASVAVALTRLRLDGRSAHAACLAWLRFAVSPRDLVGFRPRRPETAVRLEDVWMLGAAEAQRARRRVRRSGRAQSGAEVPA